MNPYEEIKFLETVHRDVPIAAHLEILFDSLKVGNQPFLPVYLDAMTASGTTAGTWKAFRRARRAAVLTRYFEHTLPIQGGRVECGVFRGFSALLMAKVARIHNPAYVGENLHLIDSFAGLSSPTGPDAIGVRRFKTGEEQPVYSHDAGHFATSVDHVASVLREYPKIGIHKGWIPDAFALLPEQRWAFVHIDVDLYDPTKSCLEYFFPRLLPGGVIVNDDFNSPLFPGGGRAWHEFMHVRGQSYVVLDTGQAIYRNEKV